MGVGRGGGGADVILPKTELVMIKMTTIRGRHMFCLCYHHHILQFMCSILFEMMMAITMTMSETREVLYEIVMSEANTKTTNAMNFRSEY